MSQAFNGKTTGDEVVAAFSSRVQGRVFLITGPTQGGIGEATVLALARGRPAALLLVGRNPTKYHPVADAVRAIDASIDVKIYGIDLASQASVRAGALKIVAENERIDVLINNAGAVSDTLQKTEDGIEFTFAVCHVGHFLLTNMLLRLLRKSDAPRIVNLTSEAFNVSNGDYDDYNFEKTPYNWNAAYALAKLANVHFTKYLAANARGILSFAVHPGAIWTTNFLGPIPDESVAKLKGFVASLGVVDKNLSEGAATSLVAALDPSLEDKNGILLLDCQPFPLRSEVSQKEELPEKLWRLSEKLVNETFAL